MIKKNILILSILSIFNLFAIAQSNSQSYKERIMGRGLIEHVAVSADGTAIAVASNRSLDIYTNQLQDITRFQEYSASIISLAWSDNNQRIASAHENGEINIWDISSQAPVYGFQLPEHESGITLSISPDNRLLSAGTLSGKIYVWNLESKSDVRVIEAHEDRVIALSWDHSGNRLASSGLDNRLVFFDGYTFEAITTLEVRFARQLLWHPSESRLIASHNNGFEIIDTHNYEVVQEIKFDNPISPLDWGDSEDTVIGVESDINRLWEVNLTTETISTISTYNNSIQVKVISNIGGFLVVNLNGSLAIVDVATNNITRTVKEYYTEIIDIAWGNKDNYIASTHKGGKLLIWNINTEEVIFSFQTNMENPIIDWGSQYIAIADNKTYILDSEDHSLLYTLEESQAPIDWDNSGSLLATQSGSGNGVTIYKMTTNQMIDTFAEQCEQVLDIAWSNDHNYIAVDCGNLYVYETANMNLLWEVENPTNTIEWSPNDSIILTSSTLSQMIEPVQRNSANGELLLTMDFQTNATWQPQGEFIVGTISEGATSFLLVQNSETLEVNSKLDNKSDYVSIIKWSENGTRFVTVDSNETIKIWESQQ